MLGSRWCGRALLGLSSLALPGCQPATQAGPHTIAAAWNYSLRLATNGTLWAAGDNSYGILGPDTTLTQRRTWAPVGHEANWVQVSAKGYHALALNANGQLFAWGANGGGELGPGAPIDYYANRPYAQLVRVPGHYAQAIAGIGYSLAFNTEGHLYAWGSNYDGVLGPAGPPPAPVSYKQLAHRSETRSVLVQVPGQWAHVAAGASHVLALTPDGRLFTWGANRRGQLGPGVPLDSLPHPQPGQVPGRYSQVAAGAYFSLALTPAGQLYAWGDNTHGQLATATNSFRATGQLQPPPLPTPRRIPGRWAQVAAGDDFVLALRADGQLWAWGSNSKGELGRSPNEDSPVPAPLPGRYTQCSAGSNHCIALGTNGRLYAWGQNDYGELGNDTAGDYFNDAPHPVPTVTP
ncbi:hypothetical protein GCM10027422_29530 [Hymenobacter arcticus]